MDFIQQYKNIYMPEHNNFLIVLCHQLGHIYQLTLLNKSTYICI